MNLKNYVKDHICPNCKSKLEIKRLTNNIFYNCFHCDMKINIYNDEQMGFHLTLGKYEIDYFPHIDVLNYNIVILGKHYFVPKYKLTLDNISALKLKIEKLLLFI